MIYVLIAAVVALVVLLWACTRPQTDNNDADQLTKLEMRNRYPQYHNKDGSIKKLEW